MNRIDKVKHLIVKYDDNGRKKIMEKMIEWKKLELIYLEELSTNICNLHWLQIQKSSLQRAISMKKKKKKKKTFFLPLMSDKTSIIVLQFFFFFFFFFFRVSLLNIIFIHQIPALDELCNNICNMSERK